MTALDARRAAGTGLPPAGAATGAETRANRQPALAVYAHDAASGLWRGAGLLVITLRGEQVAGLTRFESHTMRAFGLRRILADDDLDQGRAT
jgi:hypothetical protein